MDLAELKALMRAVEPLSADFANVASRERSRAYAALLTRFRRRAIVAGNSLLSGAPVDEDLANELRHMARAIPEIRQRVEATP
jgi:hypothetical protein